MNSLVNSKYYDDYFSFDGCLPQKVCSYDSYPVKFKAAIRGLGPNCESPLAVQKNYFKCADRFFHCGYIKTFINDGTTSLEKDSGVMILDGVDISKFTEETLKDWEVQDSLIKKLSPFFGKKGIDASNILTQEKLELMPSEAESLYNIIFNLRLGKFEEDFLGMSDNAEINQKAFKNLTLEAKTGLLSLHNIYGEIPKEFQDYIINNQWDSLSHFIKSFDIPERMKNGNYHNKVLRKDLDAHLIDSIEEHIQDGRVLGAFVIDLTNAYEADLLVYETYINTIKSILKDFYDREQCYTCKNKDIHDYAIIAYRNESMILTDFTFDYNKTMDALTKIVIPDSYALDTRTRNTSDALRKAINLLDAYKTPFDKMKTIFLFTNGDPDNDLDVMEEDKKLILDNDINAAVLDMSLGKAKVAPLIAEGPYNLLTYDSKKYQNSSKNLECLGKQVPNMFANQNIKLNKNSDFTYTSIEHNNTIHFQVTRSKDKNLKISLKLNTFPEENWMKLFVSYDYPYPDWNTNLMMHEGSNYYPLKTLIVGKDDNNPESFKNDQTLYFTLQGSNTDFGIKIEECEPNELDCKVGTNINYNEYPFPSWILAILIILGILLVVFGIWYLMRCYRKKDNVEDLEGGITSKYQNIKD